MRLYIAICTLCMAGLASGQFEEDISFVRYFIPGEFSAANDNSGKPVIPLLGLTENIRDTVINTRNSSEYGKELRNDLSKLGTKNHRTFDIFSEIIARPPATRKEFAQELVKLTGANGYQGLDIGETYLTGDSGRKPPEVMARFMRDLYREFNPANLTLSVTISGTGYRYLNLVNVMSKIKEYLTFVNLLTKDFIGSWDSDGDVKPLYPNDLTLPGDFRTRRINTTVNGWNRRGIPLEKLKLAFLFIDVDQYASAKRQNLQDFG